MKVASPFHLQRVLLHVAIVLGTLILSMIAIANGQYVVLSGLIVMLFVPLLLQTPTWLLITILAFYGTGLTLPQLPASLTVHSVLFSILVVWIIIANSLARGEAPVTLKGFSSSSFFLLLYALNIAIIIGTHGMGMRFFGSDLWGGGKYFILLITLAFFHIAPRLTLTEAQLKTGLILHVLGYLLPPVVFFLFGSSRETLLSTFFTQYGYHNILESDSFAFGNLVDFRFPTLGALGITLGLVTLALTPARMPAIMGGGLFLFTSLALTAMAGHRSRLIILLGLLTLYSFFYRDRLRHKRQLVRLLILGAGVWFVLFLTAHSLPAIFQRTLSVIPGLGLSEEAQLNAMGTVTWRVDLWKFCLSMSEPFRWIGRGFLYSPDEMTLDPGNNAGFLNLYIHHSYHNGPLSLLIDIGIPGLVASIGFFAMAILDGRRALALTPADTPFGRAYRAFFCLMTVQIFHFFLVQGDPLTSMLDIVFPFAMMKILLASQQAKEARLLQEADRESASRSPSSP